MSSRNRAFLRQHETPAPIVIEYLSLKSGPESYAVEARDLECEHPLIPKTKERRNTSINHATFSNFLEATVNAGRVHAVSPAPLSRGNPGPGSEAWSQGQ